MKDRYRFFITIEFSALAVLIASMAWLANQKQQEVDVTPLILAIPALASLLAIGGFLGAMYSRWIANVDKDKVNSIHKFLFWLLAVSFLGVWIAAIYKTFESF